jgi:hypothetical protein
MILKTITTEYCKFKFKFLYRDAFMVAMNELYNYPIYVLKRTTYPNDVTYSKTFVKANGLFLDVDGSHTEQEIISAAYYYPNENSLALVSVENELQFDLCYDFFDVEDALSFIMSESDKYTNSHIPLVAC